MRVHRFVTTTLVGLACIGTLLPASLVHAAPPRKSENSRKDVMVLDIQMDADGVLRGEVFNAKKQPVGNAVVSVRASRKEVVRVRTTEKGNFEIRDLKPGVYYIIAGTGHGIYRVWAAKSAPPKSHKLVRIVSDRTLIRAQNLDGAPAGTVRIDENGVAYGQVHVIDTGGLVPVGPNTVYAGTGAGFLDSVGVYDVLLLGAATAGIIIGVKALDQANDADDRIDNIVNTP
jgi:hypothetical protein